MPISPEVAKRIAALTQELDEGIHRTWAKARNAYIWSQALVIMALLCSVAAAVSGIFFLVPAKIVGGIAALPPLIAYVAANLKLETRSSWHYRKVNGLSALRSRLLYQLPEEPSADNVAAVASDLNKLDEGMQEEWEKTVTVNWTEILKQKATLVSDLSGGSSATPNKGPRTPQ